MGKIILISIALGCFALAQNSNDSLFPAESRYIYRDIDDVQILTSNNQSLSISQIWKNKPILVTLIFSRCAGICSPLVSSLKFSVEKISKNRKELDFYVVILSFDTADTPENMKVFSESFGLSDDRNWIFGIFADPKQIEKFSQDVGFWFKLIDSTNQYDHPGIVVGIRNGKVVRILVGGNITVVKLQEIVNEIKGEIVPFYQIQRNIAFRCFNYDPETGKVKIGVGTLILLIPAFLTFAITFVIFASQKPSIKNKINGG